MRCCSLKNAAVWLVLRFLDHNSITRFCSDVRFLQKVRILIAISYTSKKFFIVNLEHNPHLVLLFLLLNASWLYMDYLFVKTPKISFFGPADLTGFLSNNSSRTVWVCLTILWSWRLKGWFMVIKFQAKNRKKTDKPILEILHCDGGSNRVKFIGHFR